MNSSERVLTAINHKNPDRIPLDLGSMYETSIVKSTYLNLRKYLNLKVNDVETFDVIQQLPVLEEDILNFLGVDVRGIYCSPSSKWSLKIEEIDSYFYFADEWGIKWYMPKENGYYYDARFHPLKEHTFEEIKKYKFPDLSDNTRFEGCGTEAKNLSQNTNYSIWGGAIPALFYTAWTLRGMQDFTIDLYADPKLGFYLVDRVMDFWMEYMEKFLNQVGSYVDVFWGGGDDWGHQGGPMVSPDLFKAEVVPRLKKMISFFKSKTNAKCCYHSCGSVYWCLEDLIEVGIDIIHPLQPNAYANDTDKIKKEFGSRICFHGGTNNQGVFDKNINILTMDTLKRIKDLAPGGGYIFSSGHNIQANTSPENIVRLFELAKEYGKYPIDISKIDSRIEQEQKILNIKNFKNN